MEASRAGNSLCMVIRFRAFTALTVAASLMGCSGVIGGSSGSEDPNQSGGENRPPGSTGGATVGKSGVTLTCTSSVANVSATPMRRLTRQEYAASVRDLLGIASVPTDQIATDEKVGPFYSNAVSTITDLWTEQYMQSAESLAQTAVAKVDTLIGCNRTAMGDSTCAGQFIDKFGLKAFRRPLSAEEKTRYTALYTAYTASDGFAIGIRMVIQTMLQSPHFLYHVEFNSPAPSTSSDVLSLGPYEIAARLSFFAWGSTPDDALLAEAAAGGLADTAAVQKQAERLLADPRAKDTFGAFHLQWLGMDDGDLTKDKTMFPAFTPELSQAMHDETVNFADYLFRQGDGKLETLLTAPFSILSAPLANLYGAKQPAGMGGTTALDPTQRSGILTQANFLASHAHPNQTSPVSRGVVIRRNVLCQGLPDPPPNVNNAAPDPAANATTRERFKAHETVASCGGCHKLIDGIGFGFENYDAIGAFRSTENNLPIDASGQIEANTSVDIDGPFNGAIELSKKLSTSSEVRECMAKQWFRYALARTEADNDSCSVKAAYDAFQASQYDVRKLLVAIVTTDAFRYRRPGVQ
jgi:Protein of unknown function (DUF1592)/Protein of unknown function (DUF1588)/Protein of unknown function (DUF1595)/Protein of unknown function (DUF1585)/Protein of unknown function (DUF1587)